MNRGWFAHDYQGAFKNILSAPDKDVLLKDPKLLNFMNPEMRQLALELIKRNVTDMAKMTQAETLAFYLADTGQSNEVLNLLKSIKPNELPVLFGNLLK